MASTQTSTSFNAVSLLDGKIVDHMRQSYPYDKTEGIVVAWKDVAAHYAKLGYTATTVAKAPSRIILFSRESDGASVYVCPVDLGRGKHCATCATPFALADKPAWCPECQDASAPTSGETEQELDDLFA